MSYTGYSRKTGIPKLIEAPSPTLTAAQAISGEFVSGNVTTVYRCGRPECRTGHARSVLALAARLSAYPRFGKQKFVKLQAASASYCHLVTQRDACHCVGGEAKSAIKLFRSFGALEHQRPFIAACHRHEKNLLRQTGLKENPPRRSGSWVECAVAGPSGDVVVKAAAAAVSTELRRGRTGHWYRFRDRCAPPNRRHASGSRSKPGAASG